MKNTSLPCQGHPGVDSDRRTGSRKTNAANYNHQARESRLFDPLHYIVTQDEAYSQTFRPKGLFVRFREDMMWSPKQYKLFIGDMPDSVDHGEVLKNPSRESKTTSCRFK